MMLVSYSLGLTGKADLVEFHKADGTGTADEKEGADETSALPGARTSRPHGSHPQRCHFSNFAVSIVAKSFSFSTRCSVNKPFALQFVSKTPAAEWKASCKGCSLLEICMPKAWRPVRSHTNRDRGRPVRHLALRRHPVCRHPECPVAHHRDRQNVAARGCGLFAAERQGGRDVRAPGRDMVQNSLRHFDAQRYRLFSWVIMPNHVHVLCRQVPGNEVSSIVKSWKSFTAHAINRALSRTGSFWQEDYFDRYIRDQNHVLSVVQYIERNPVTAGLCKSPEDWPWSSAALNGKRSPVVAPGTADVPSATLSINAADVPSATLSINAADVPSGTLSINAADVPSATLSINAADVPSATLSINAADVPSATLSINAADVPSATDPLEFDHR